MVKKCSVGGCGKGYAVRSRSLHSIPLRNGRYDEVWIEYLRTANRNPDWQPCIASAICSVHFAQSDFTNHRQFMLGLAEKLLLKPDAVPKMTRSTKDTVEQRAPMSNRIHRTTPIVAPRVARDDTDVDISGDIDICVAEEVGAYLEVVDTSPCTVECRALSQDVQMCEAGHGQIDREVQCNLGNLPPQDCPRDVDDMESGDESGCDDDMESNDESDSDDEDEIADPSWFPDTKLDYDSDEEEIVDMKPSMLETSQTPPEDQTKYIVFAANLLELFASCTACHEPTSAEIVKTIGTYIKVEQKCKQCGFHRSWESQPLLREKLPAGNLLLAAGMFFSGSCIQQVLRLLSIVKIACFSRVTYFKHQTNYLEPSVVSVWKEEQRTLIEHLADNGTTHLAIAGDARSDSPGYCAKYGAYSIIECGINKVLDIQLVQNNEVQNSSWCELEGLQRCFNFLEDHVLMVDELITDRHKSIAKWVREQHPEVTHLNDVWHTAKGVGKKVDVLGKSFPDVAQWKRSIVNHLYWTASSSRDDDGAMKEARWESVLDHIVDDHLNCYHDPLEGEDRDKMWLDPKSVEYLKLENILANKNLLKDVRNLSPKYQTSNLEAFHSLIIRFAPKHTAFSYTGMLCRLLLAGLHYNENSTKKQDVTESGELRWKVGYKKYKHGASNVRRVREDATWGYADRLVQFLCAGYRGDPQHLKHSIDELRENSPASLSSAFDKAEKATVVEDYATRFSELTLGTTVNP